MSRVQHDASELERFKTIPIEELAAAHGWQRDQRKSSRYAPVMRGPDGTRIVCRAKSNHHLYFDAGTGTGGTAIDFVRHHLLPGCSLGEVRKVLRRHVGVPSEPPARVPERCAAGPMDLSESWSQLDFLSLTGRMYLVNDRGLPPDLVDDLAAGDAVRSDGNGVCWPHRIPTGRVCGWEIKNAWPPYCRGGSKALWGWCSDTAFGRIVVAEGPIDAISYQAMYPEPSLLLSMGGQPGSETIRMLRTIALRHSVPMLFCLDSDEAGQAIFRRVSLALGDSGGACLYVPPQGVKDWNDALRNAQCSADRVAAAPTGG